MDGKTRKTAEEWAKELCEANYWGDSDYTPGNNGVAGKISRVMEAYLHQETKELIEALERISIHSAHQYERNIALSALTNFKEHHGR